MASTTSTWDFTSSSTPKMSLKDFLTLLQDGGFNTQDALRIIRVLAPAGLSSPDKLCKSSDRQLRDLGIQDSQERKRLLNIAKTGTVTATKTSSPSKSKQSGMKRKRENDLDKPLPNGDEDMKKIRKGNFDFREVLDETILSKSSVVVNRAPVMTAWATIVGERQGFNREEALSVAQTYTEMNATSKGVSLGIFEKSKEDSMIGQSQPYVELMGRKVPVLAMKDETWRGLCKGEMVEPQRAYDYMTRAFRQQFGPVMGALTLLANSVDPDELNQKGYGMYIAFRPDCEQWGSKSTMRLSTILDLRQLPTQSETKDEGVGADTTNDEVDQDDDTRKTCNDELSVQQQEEDNQQFIARDQYQNVVPQRSEVNSSSITATTSPPANVTALITENDRLLSSSEKVKLSLADLEECTPSP